MDTTVSSGSAGEAPAGRSPAGRLLARLTAQLWRPATEAVASALVAAAFEGATMAIFALALQAVTGTGPPSLAASLGPLGGTVAGLWQTLGREAFFLAMVVAGIAAQVTRSGVQFVGAAAAAGIQASAEATLRRDLFQRYLALGWSHVRRFRVGDLANLVDQVHYIGHCANRLNQLVTQLLLLVAYLAVLTWLSWRATLLAALLMVAGSLALRRIVARVRLHADSYKRATVRLSEQAVDLLNGLKTVLFFGREDYALRRINEQIDEAARATRRTVVAQSLVAPIVDSAAAIGVGAILVAGMLLLGFEEEAGLAQFATFLFVLYRAAPRLSLLNKDWAVLANYLPFVERTARFLEEQVPQRPMGSGAPFAGLRAAIRFEGVSLSYEDQESPAVVDVSFVLPRGAMVAIVGESGAGKSTLADLLARIVDPSAGRITVDGIDLRELEWQSWRERIGVVGQGTILFHDTIHENIALGRPVAETEVEAAARDAHAHEFITRLPHGYQTVVGDLGYRLSGGERQRIAIARALLARPQVLVMDEATSDLDSHSESLIQDALRTARGRCAVLVIAHRLSTVTAADEILVLDRGRIVERGAHEALLAQGGRYARLWALQHRAVEATVPSP